MRQQAIRACDVEPIHTPGKIQEHGVMFVLDHSGRVSFVSDNCAAYTGCLPNDIIGKHISSILQPDAAANAPSGSEFAIWPEHQEVIYEWGRLVPCIERAPILEALSHRNSQNYWIVECELAEGSGLHYEGHERRFHRKIQQAQQNLHDADDLNSLVTRTVDEIFHCFGFDRVMAYRFDALWNGAVIAEARQPHLDSYMGQQFPASDIPTQARLTFMNNWLRCIPDVRFLPSPMLGHPNGEDSAPLDMMLCHLRAPSPVHIEYLINMGVRATLTISLLSEGKLWGLIACHHLTPAQLPYEKRQAAEMIGRTASALLASKEANDNIDYRRQLDVVQAKLFALMNQEEDLVPGLISNTPNLLDLVGGAQSASAAIFFEGRWSFLGQIPPLAELNGFIKWLSRHQQGSEVWHTEMLVAEYPASEEFCRVASGVLAINIPKSDNTYVLWFRPEVPTVIDWAGRPEKDLHVDASGVHLHPRKSFERWQEVVKNRSIPWRSVEMDAAMILRKNIIELDLKRQFQRERNARADTEAEKKRFQFLADATGLLGQSLDYEITLNEFANSLTTFFCDWACIYSDTDKGLQRTTISHASASGRKAAEKLRDFGPIYQYMPTQTLDVFEKGERLYAPRADAWMRQNPPSEYATFLVEQMGFESMMLLPIVARDKILGVIKCVRTNRTRRFTPDDFRLGLQLSQRAASCIDNALLYRASQEAIQDRDHVMGVVSHDLRNPLGVIRLTADRITRKYAKADSESLPEMVASGLDKIRLACRRMNGLIEDVLSLSKIEAGRFTVDLHPVSVAEILDEAVGLLEPLAEASGAKLCAESTLADAQVSCDSDRILQVFSNLIGNAIKFTPAGGVITVRAQRAPQSITFSVSDTGHGIPAQHLPHVFDRFWQAARTSRQGAGLGLAIVKGIIDAHGGEISVDSTQGKGTTFAFRLAAIETPPA